jgi:hypothetical protein
MSKYLGSLTIVLFAVACGGTTDTGGESSGGTSQGGSDAGHDSGGSAGKGSGGANRAGSNPGGSNTGGSNTGGFNTGGSAIGGAGSYDPRCPAHQPMGACGADDATLSCQYELGSGCLCYDQPQGTFAYCQRVDPNCMYVPPGVAGAAGTTGTGGTAAASGFEPGVGGFSTKIALPPKLRCGCSAGMWACSQGF